MKSSRRSLLQSAAVAFVLFGTAQPRKGHAHHGWGAFKLDDPVYLEGIAREVKWRNPHAEVSLELSRPLRLPQDLASRPIPAQSAGIKLGALLEKARVPSGTDRLWDIELAPLFRMAQWSVPELRAGQSLAVLGFALREPPAPEESTPGTGGASRQQGESAKAAPLLRAELLFFEGRTYPLRSGPA